MTYTDTINGETVEEIVFLNGLDVVRAVETTFSPELSGHTYDDAISGERVAAAGIEILAKPGIDPYGRMTPYTLFEGVYWECVAND